MPTQIRVKYSQVFLIYDIGVKKKLRGQLGSTQKPCSLGNYGIPDAQLLLIFLKQSVQLIVEGKLTFTDSCYFTTNATNSHKKHDIITHWHFGHLIHILVGIVVVSKHIPINFVKKIQRNR